MGVLKYVMTEISSHPLWPDYEETQGIIRELRQMAESGNLQANERIDVLEDRLTDLIEQIAKDSGIKNERLSDPLWKEWNKKWKDLRQARHEEKYEEEETIWLDLKDILTKIDIRKSFSAS